MHVLMSNRKSCGYRSDTFQEYWKCKDCVWVLSGREEGWKSNYTSLISGQGRQINLTRAEEKSPWRGPSKENPTGNPSGTPAGSDPSSRLLVTLPFLRMIS